jgi:transposase
VRGQIQQIESARLDRLKHARGEVAHAMVMGIGIETADMLVQEETCVIDALSRGMRASLARPTRAGGSVAEKGLARSGNPRVRRGMIQLAWRFLMFQKDSALAQRFRTRTENARGTRKTMIVALARKLLMALRRLVREGVVPDVGCAVCP